MEWGFVLGLGVITLAVIGLVIYFGLKLSKGVQRRVPDSIFVQSRLTLTGTALYACMVGFWLVCLVARAFRSDSSLGAFLGTADGAVAVLVASFIFGGIAAEILKKLGYPITKRDGH